MSEHVLLKLATLTTTLQLSTLFIRTLLASLFGCFKQSPLTAWLVFLHIKFLQMAIVPLSSSSHK